MVRPPRPSFPAPSEPNLRRLGVGSASGAERPLRAQLVVALVCLLVLVAVPLYLWRRPVAHDTLASSSSSASAAPLVASPPEAGPGPDPKLLEQRVRLGPPQRVKCSTTQRAKGQEGPLCDQLPALEEALAKAIRETVDCAPQSREQGSINFVLQVDFLARRLHVFPGASGQWKGAQARRAAKCVLRSLSVPAWTSIQHQYGFYQIAILATYPATGAAPPPASGSAVPLFD